MISYKDYHIIETHANIDLQLCLTLYDIVMHYKISELGKLPINFHSGDIVFLYGNLGVGKTTLIQELLREKGIDQNLIKSPTYTYFQKYFSTTSHQTYYHFDLYRMDEYEVFLNIGGEECLMDPTAIKFIEWPELLESTFSPDIKIEISETSDEGVRNISITYSDVLRKKI